MIKEHAEEIAHAQTLRSTITWLHGFSAARGNYNGYAEDLPPLYALERAEKYFQRAANGEDAMDALHERTARIKALAAMGAQDGALAYIEKVQSAIQKDGGTPSFITRYGKQIPLKSNGKPDLRALNAAKRAAGKDKGRAAAPAKSGAKKIAKRGRK